MGPLNLLDFILSYIENNISNIYFMNIKLIKNIINFLFMYFFDIFNVSSISHENFTFLSIYPWITDIISIHVSLMPNKVTLIHQSKEKNSHETFFYFITENFPFSSHKFYRIIQFGNFHHWNHVSVINQMCW